MAKNTTWNPELAALKAEATAKGLAFNKNASLAQIKQLLATDDANVGNTPSNEWDVPPADLDTLDTSSDWATAPDSEWVGTVELNAPTVIDTVNIGINSEKDQSLQDAYKQIEALKEMVLATGDENKIAEFKRAEEDLKKFAFSVKLFPVRRFQAPVIKWRTTADYVGREWKDVDQRIEITYLNEQGKEESQEILLVDFAKRLVRSEKIEAIQLENPNWSPLYINKEINPVTKVEYFLMKPDEKEFIVTMTVSGLTFKILSTYLNA